MTAEEIDLCAKRAALIVLLEEKRRLLKKIADAQEDCRLTEAAVDAMRRRRVRDGADD